MAKTYKGSELIRMVEDNQIKDLTRIKSDDGNIFIYCANDSTFYWSKSVGGERVPIYTFLNHTFVIIEEQQDIDIQGIEEFSEEYLKEELTHGEEILGRKLNELVKAVKQQDRNIKDKE